MFEYLFTLRLLHIVAGAFWAGTAISLALFIFPAVKSLGPDGGKVMQKIASTNRFPMVMSLASTITILTGALLYWEYTRHLQMVWITSNYGMALTIGGLAALVAWLLGFIINKPGATRMAKIGHDIALAGGPPSDAQLSEIRRIQSRIGRSTNVIAILLLLSVVAMSIVRYL